MHVHCIFAFFADKINEVIKISIYTAHIMRQPHQEVCC